MQHSHKPFRTDNEHVLVLYGLSQHSVGCCPSASAEVAPQVKIGESCHGCLHLFGNTQRECDSNTLNLTCTDSYPWA